VPTGTVDFVVMTTPVFKCGARSSIQVPS
jgi:hypothetical protein